MTAKEDWLRDKKWKDLYTRSMTLARAQTLGLDYPKVTRHKLELDEMTTKNAERSRLLFVCSRNQWRSPTAEQIWRSDNRLDVRSGGTSPSARYAVSAQDIS